MRLAMDWVHPSILSLSRSFLGRVRCRPWRLFDYLPQDGIVLVDDPIGIDVAGQELEKDLDRILRRAKEEERFYLEKESLFHPWTRCSAASTAFR